MEQQVRPIVNWEAEHRKGKEFFDDGTNSFFWQAHTFLALVLFSAVLIYVAIFEVPTDDTDFNIKRGCFAILLAFIVFGIINTPDGPFKRPHPVFWRLILVLSVAYELLLIFLMFQTPEYTRQWLRIVDPSLGVPLVERNYADKCVVYDASVPDNPFHHVWEKMDMFVAVHFFGWWAKTLILRDYWLCQVLSIMFEVLEYTLEHQLPNFSECWWDHWIMDFLVCNWLGIHFGMKTLHYLEEKTYNWRGLWNIPGYKGKIKRIALQFSPYSWTDFDFRPTLSLKRWLFTLLMIFLFLVGELNNFYLKFVLWMEPGHPILICRALFFLFMGSVGMREVFQYLDDPNMTRFGRQAWMQISIILTEALIVFKYDFELVSKPLPSHVSAIWAVGLAALITYTFWKFYLHRPVSAPARGERQVSVSDYNSDGQDSSIDDHCSQAGVYSHTDKNMEKNSVNGKLSKRKPLHS